MLGCQDFCGYYDWTFHYLRRRFGDDAVRAYWAQAIAGDSQQHYLRAGAAGGLRGLSETWLKTGDEEGCDWSVTLDEANNLLRLDMRECPSKGFLLNNDLNADEDYCDHCQGWITPALDSIGIDVTAHQHNHCGQCWWEFRARTEPQPEVAVDGNIRADPRWGQGYIHSFGPAESPPGRHDHDGLADWFAADSILVVVAEGWSPEGRQPPACDEPAWLIDGRRYAEGAFPSQRVRGVILDHDPGVLAGVARRRRQAQSPPLLMHAYLPGRPILNFADHGLPRAVPMLPLLIRTGLYRHTPGNGAPSAAVLGALVGVALNKHVVLRGYRRATGADAPTDHAAQNEASSDMDALARARRYPDAKLTIETD